MGVGCRTKEGRAGVKRVHCTGSVCVLPASRPVLGVVIFIRVASLIVSRGTVFAASTCSHVVPLHAVWEGYCGG